jgi:N-acylneuraminate cytidylyltransferase/CMP-N,N'-diacetyllegionaminic acid synthase
VYKNKRILGLIPARGGSKGLPGKNIRPLLGKPLIAWTIEQALSSKYLDKVVVTTDDTKIARVANKYGAEIPFIRPKSLATDRAKRMGVIFHAIEYLLSQGEKYDYLAFLEPTSPLREVRDIDNAIKTLINNKTGALSIVSVSKVEATHPAFDVLINKKSLIVPYEGDFSKAGRRQDLSDLYYFEGTIYVSSVEALYEHGEFIHDKTLPHIVPRWKSFEVDELVDLLCIETVMKNIDKIREAK